MFRKPTKKTETKNEQDKNKKFKKVQQIKKEI
jgi:hypothetical protein